MKLKDYLDENNKSVEKFARKLQCSTGHLSRVIHMKIKPSKRLAKDIQDLTGGVVTVLELLEPWGIDE